MAKDLKINTSTGALGSSGLPQRSSLAKPEKHPGGRPSKTEGPKNENFSISMDPILYEKYIIISKKLNHTSMSEFFRNAVKSYCRDNDISLMDPDLEEQAIINYNLKLEEKEQKRKNRK